jgi:hypothetical protein
MDVITRLAMFIVAVLLALDAFGSERNENLRADDYHLHFVGGRVDSCDVGWSAWNTLQDGDEVSVDTSRVFKSCDGIRRGDQVISQAHLHKGFLLIPIALLLAAAFGWIEFNRGVDDDRRGGWWFS